MQKLRLLFHRHRKLVQGLLLGLLSVIFVPILTNLFSNWLTAVFGQTPTGLLRTLAEAALVAIVLLAFSLFIGKERQAWVLVPRERQPPRFPGLILLVGPGTAGRDPLQAPAASIDHHFKGPKKNRLKVCWLVASSQAVHVAEALRTRYEAAGLRVFVMVIQEAFHIQETYETVRRIYHQEAAASGLNPEQVISDFTGATHPMAAGMVLACQERYPMQYTSGKPGTASAPIFIQFKPASDLQKDS